MRGRGSRWVVPAVLGLLALASAVPTPAASQSSSCAAFTVSKLASASVVSVLVIDGQRPQVATGFAIGADRVVTVAHAVLNAGSVRIAVPGGSDTRDARVVTLDSRRDLAILEVSGLHLAALESADTTPAAASCATVLSVRDGHVVTVDATVRGTVKVTIDRPVRARRSALGLAADIRRGDSGAPVVDSAGEVEGIVFAASSSGPPTGWAVDASELRGLLDGQPPTG